MQRKQKAEKGGAPKPVMEILIAQPVNRQSGAEREDRQREQVKLITCWRKGCVSEDKQEQRDVSKNRWVEKSLEKDRHSWSAEGMNQCSEALTGVDTCPSHCAQAPL